MFNRMLAIASPDLQTRTPTESSIFNQAPLASSDKDSLRQENAASPDSIPALTTATQNATPQAPQLKIENHLLDQKLSRERLQGATISTLVIHSMFAPKSSAPLAPEDCRAVLAKQKVSAHYLISQEGAVWQLVDEQRAAKHAGRSRMPFKGDHRSGVSNFSIGIELINSPKTDFPAAQYKALAALVADVLKRHPEINSIVSHQAVAFPRGRKADPGARFDWKCFKAELAELGVDTSKLNFATGLPAARKKSAPATHEKTPGK